MCSFIIEYYYYYYHSNSVYIYIKIHLNVYMREILFAHVTIIINGKQLDKLVGMHQTSIDSFDDKLTFNVNSTMIHRSNQCKKRQLNSLLLLQIHNIRMYIYEHIQCVPICYDFTCKICVYVCVYMCFLLLTSVTLSKFYGRDTTMMI